MEQRIKNRLYGISLFFAKLHWRLFKPATSGARMILVAKNKVFLVQHRNSHTWNLPGGGIKKNENPSKGALRELFEETKIQIESSDYLLGTYSSNQEGKRDTVYIFVKEIPEMLQPRPALELRDARWFSLDHLPETATRSTRSRIEEYQKGECGIQGSWGK